MMAPTRSPSPIFGVLLLGQWLHAVGFRIPQRPPAHRLLAEAWTKGVADVRMNPLAISNATDPLEVSTNVSDDVPRMEQDTTHCCCGSGERRCPAASINYLSAGGGGQCQFRYTNHNGRGENTGSPVVTSGSCVITIADLNTGSSTNKRVRAWIRSLAAHDDFTKDDAGHILANQLGGCGTCPINLFPQNLRVNRGIYRVMETEIFDCIAATNATAHLSWKFRYKSPALAHLRPRSYTYSAEFSGGRSACPSLSQTFDNLQWESSAADELPFFNPWLIRPQSRFV